MGAGKKLTHMINLDDRLIKEVSPKIGPNALSVLLAIAIHLNQKTNRCFPSHYRLMELTGIGKNAVYDALKVLKAEGLLLSEQIIDTKKKQFGRRTFRLTTRFIKIFVDAIDAEPLPESREPESREPESREPESRETYQLNEVEQLNEFEQINNASATHTRREIENLICLNTEQEKSPSPGSAAPLPKSTFDTWVDVLTGDYRIREGFTITQKIPGELFEDYVTRFTALARTQPEKYSRKHDLTGHFLNWSRIEYQQRGGAPSPSASQLNTARPAGIPKNIPTYGA